MTATSYILGIAAALLTLAVVIEMLRRRRLRERHATWWLIAGTLALIVGVFPKTLEWAADVAGVAIPINLVFFVSVVILFLVCIQHSSELTKLDDQTRTLAEQTALLELRIRELEQNTQSSIEADDQ
ncbi:DUF2304 domain-containing protein [Cryobacterium glaciale]|uniref:DUF2304 domain-containing protein n=1 Tax=Cryobacterium glaciale TaxID=1259145 RepID=A0A4R8UXU5_9MICO|nr:DUF2304 domain-containing protein [Cryobacterium glaciale]TFB74335.1 DUF2304 domain-containing protein [Cryobacterium glaciale]